MAVENPHGISIDMSQFTTNVVAKDESTNSLKPDMIVQGDGIFDILMNTATTHLKAQFDSNRIRDEDYANAYLQVYQATLQAAVQIWLQKPIADLQRESEEAKKELYRRQIKGFDEDYKQKILKICMDAWAVGFSVARDSFQASGIPGPMQKATIDEFFNKLVYTEMDKFEWKEGKHPDAENRIKLSSDMTKIINTEAQA